MHKQLNLEKNIQVQLMSFSHTVEAIRNKKKVKKNSNKTKVQV